MSNFADDDLLLNTGVSFPIAFQAARIIGTEVKLDIPRSGTFSGLVSYANLHGTGELPITGGLFLGDEATASFTSTDRFPVSQDQRHTVRGRVSDQITSSAWVALAASYGSGLPVEFAGIGRRRSRSTGNGSSIASISTRDGSAHPSRSMRPPDSSSQKRRRAVSGSRLTSVTSPTLST
jgi:hypothetical protein